MVPTNIRAEVRVHSKIDEMWKRVELRFFQDSVAFGSDQPGLYILQFLKMVSDTDYSLVEDVTWNFPAVQADYVTAMGYCLGEAYEAPEDIVEVTTLCHSLW
ncbi:hypothetical protein ACJ73_04643 [Blastomyces percursus]|uniref:Uncharacterized protein n=1 Tax=Blastomyces percursus TaxID=1658174 RepID=A0A1J9QUT9_9EURO|nr:hypothetical protein ACJ73_04643 [Blastomyces percursus]